MRLAVGRLRVSVGISHSIRIKSCDEILHDKARAYVERSLRSSYKRTVLRPHPWWRTDLPPTVREWWDVRDGLLESRTATALSERVAVIRILNAHRIRAWRWRKRRKLELALCKQCRIAKWW